MKTNLSAILILLIICLSQEVLAQNRLHITAFGGLSNYQGDLQYRRFTTNQSNAAFSLGLTYDLSPNFSLQGMATRAKLGAHDQYNLASLQFRNLSFETVIYEGSLVAQYRIFDLNEKRFTPYLFAGIGVFRFQPYTFDSTGAKRFLKPLSTEGQGLPEYPDRKPYNNFQAAIPLGAGIKFRVTEHAILGFELGLRQLFTDYLDDVSTSYPNPEVLRAAKGERAVELSYRGAELKDGNPAFPTGAVRGSAKYNDFYYFTGITLQIGINTGNWFRPLRSGGGSSRSTKGMACPVNVY